jgi:hypothetical protein
MGSKIISDTHAKLTAVEQRLAKALQPIKAPREFVQTVRQRMHFAPPGVAVARVMNPQKLLLILGGVVSGLLVLVTLARAIYYFAKGKQGL